MTTKTFQLGSYCFRRYNADTIAVSVGILESIRMSRELNKSTLVVY